MHKRNTVHASQLLPEPRKRPWWKRGGKGLIEVLKAALKLLGLLLRLINLLGGIVKAVVKLFDLIWPG